MTSTGQNADSKPGDEVVVFLIVRDSKCVECGDDLYSGSMLRMENGKPYCLACADLDHLEYLPRGDAALTRRSRKFSRLSAVVVRFSRTRGRYERQGVLIEPAALARAEEECRSDQENRARIREKAAVAREAMDQRHHAGFVAKILERFPRCPSARAATIAAHACLKYSGRVGRSAMARGFDAVAIDLAVRAHIRHAETDYDRLLNRGMDRGDARLEVADQIAKVEADWCRGTTR